MEDYQEQEYEFLRRLDEEAEAQRVPADPEDRRIGRPEGRQQDDEEKAGVIKKGLTEIQVHEVTGAARAAAAEAREPGQADEEALRQLQPGQEPSPGQDRAAQERRRPDELVIKLARIGRSANQPKHWSTDSTPPGAKPT